MPGTIQVSILGLVGLPSSSVGIKVSVGKQTHETKEKGDFSFPLASLRDNLNVWIHDSEGNDISQTVVETRSIVEKGVWDDLFALKGGGHVHMRLHFNLTEHELNRIRSMRESATRKKQEDLLKKSHSSSDLVVASGETMKTSAVSDAEVLSKVHHDQKKQALPTSLSVGALDNLPVKGRVKEVAKPQHQEPQSPLDERPSNVRKMILAFETSPVKEEELATAKTTEAPQISSSTAMEVPSKPVLSSLETPPAASSIPEGINKARDKIRDFEDPFKEKLGQKIEHSKELTVQNIDLMEPDSEELKEEKMSPKQSRRSSTFERTKPCWNTIAREFPSRKRAATELFTEPRWRSKLWKSSQHRLKSKECYRNDSFRGWIFLDETICSCIPSDGRPFVDVLEGYLCNPETNQGKLEDVGVGTIEDSNRSVQYKKLDSASPPNKGASRRPTGQAIKIAIMVGFGILVFLTRQRK